VSFARLRKAHEVPASENGSHRFKSRSFAGLEDAPLSDTVTQVVGLLAQSGVGGFLLLIPQPAGRLPDLFDNRTDFRKTSLGCQRAVTVSPELMIFYHRNPSKEFLSTFNSYIRN
jgi:hypothetical protein